MKSYCSFVVIIEEREKHTLGYTYAAGQAAVVKYMQLIISPM